MLDPGRDSRVEERDASLKGLLQRFGCRPMPTSMERWVNFGMQVGDSHICGYHVDNNAWS
jgi:hypothetical protein